MNIPFSAVIIALGLLLTATPSFTLPPSDSVADPTNKHNLSVSGPGTPGVTIAASEERVCIFCHTPHHASDVTPLWSRDLSTAIYTPYQSTTLKASPGQPTGPSRLCLSCHDGTIALGMLTGGKVIAGLSLMPTRSNLETDLSDDHPISFDYGAATAINPNLRQVADLPPEIYLSQGRLECNSCHNPHRDMYPPADKPLETGKFLVMDNSKYSALCTACHYRPDFAASAHYTEHEACDKCHKSHKAPYHQRLLREATNQDTCLLRCHNSDNEQEEKGANIRITSIPAQIHTVGSTLLNGHHDAAENPADPAQFASDQAHVECVDCHNPCLTRHEDTPLSTPPAINGRQINVLIARDEDGTKHFAITEFDVCFKCHGDQPFTPPAVPRMIQSGNQAYRFATDNYSYHPVLAPGLSTNVPSLRLDISLFTPQRLLSTGSRIYCTDCHNSDNATKVGGNGANGPHGSQYGHILMDRYEQNLYPEPYTDDNYKLCYRCHDKNILLSETQSTFPKHYYHVVTQGVSCSVCHDPHGVPKILGATADGNARLINFDARFVAVGGTFSISARSCTVSCHSANPRTY